MLLRLRRALPPRPAARVSSLRAAAVRRRAEVRRGHNQGYATLANHCRDSLLFYGWACSVGCTAEDMGCADRRQGRLQHPRRAAAGGTPVVPPPPNPLTPPCSRQVFSFWTCQNIGGSRGEANSYEKEQVRVRAAHVARLMPSAAAADHSENQR